MTEPPPRAPSTLGRGAPRASVTATEIAAGMAAVAALYFGRDILIPLALAVLIAFALSPIALQLRRIGLRRVPSVLLVFLLFVAVLLAFALLMASQIIDLASNLPQYRGNLEVKIEAFRDAAPAGGVFDRLWRMAADLGDAVSEAFGAAGAAADRPLAVRIESEESPIATLWALLAPMLAPVGQIGIMLILVIFLLLQREDLRNRLIWLLGDRDLTRATAALNDAASRVGRLLLAQAGLNIAYGVIFAFGLWIIGVPNPVLWGIIGGILRFIPIIGTIIGAVLPAAMAFAADPGWTMVIATVILVVSLDLVANNVIEPLLYGNRTGLSAFAILLAMVFWVTMWGIPGLLLAVPLTVCLTVLGRHMPRMAFLDVLLSSTPALTPEARLYQRILAEDAIEASEIAETALAEGSRRHLFETMLVPAIRRAHEDRRRGALEGAKRRAVWHGLRTLVEDLDDHTVELGQDSATADAGPVILCVPARDDLDTACAEMLRQLLADAGAPARLVAPGQGTPEGGAPAIVLLCWAYPPARGTAVRGVQRLRRALGPGPSILLAAPTATAGEAAGIAEATGVPVATELTEAAALAKAALPDPPLPPQPAATAVVDAAGPAGKTLGVRPALS